ncbi:hypothetical protein CSE45_4716 [Citreicella sp. SE45]|nr:hypothetical protein CSE45_4716 [Citreicella sp. SE45]
MSEHGASCSARRAVPVPVPAGTLACDACRGVCPRGDTGHLWNIGTLIFSAPPFTLICQKCQSLL